jgi:hypothetical protein
MLPRANVRTFLVSCCSLRAFAFAAAAAAAGAITSWRFVADEQLKHGMVQMMRYLHSGMGGAVWAEKVQRLDAGVRAKLEELCR